MRLDDGLHMGMCALAARGAVRIARRSLIEEGRYKCNVDEQAGRLV